MNTKSLCIILDPAHGNGVKGKCSPDGTHKEYLWSREICKKLASKLDTLGYEVHFTTQGLRSLDYPNESWKLTVSQLQM